MAEVANLRQETRQLKRENRDLHMFANNYSTSMKRNLNQLQDSEGWIPSDHQRFVAVLQRHFLPSSSGVRPNIGALNNQPLVLLLPGVPPSAEASRKQHL
ncbi:hypothetical protein ACFX13_003584 [Malus domestica]